MRVRPRLPDVKEATATCVRCAQAFEWMQVGPASAPPFCPACATVDLRCADCRDEDGQPTRFTHERVYSFRRILPDPDVCPACYRAADRAENREEATARLEGRAAHSHEGWLLAEVERAGGNFGKCRDRETGALLSLDTYIPYAGRVRAHREVRAFASAVLRRADRFSPVPSVLLHSEGYGRGKTVLLHLVMMALIEGGLRARTGVLYLPFQKLLVDVQSGYGGKAAGGESWGPLLKRCAAADVVIVNDLAAGKVTAETWRLALAIAEEREDRPTLISMNGHPEDLMRHIPAGDRSPEVEMNIGRLVSRLGAYRCVEAGGDVDGRLGAPPAVAPNLKAAS